MWWFWVETWSKKGLIQCYAYTNVANRFVFSFVWRKFSSVGIREWWDELKNGQKLKFGDAHAPQEISKRYKRQSLGMPPRHPFFIGKIRSPFNTLYFYCFMHYAFFLERQLFLVLCSFIFCNKWLDPNKFLLKKLPYFSFAKNTPFFTLIILTSVHLFLELRLVFVFRLDLCSDLVISFYQGVFWPLVHVGFHQKSYLKKVRMVLEKRKSFMQKSGTRRSLCRLRPRPFACHAWCLFDSMLSGFAVA
jgi:hypothetical protein